MAVSALYIAILAGLLVVLSARVIRMRGAVSQSLGDGGHVALERRIRAQGNLAEYGPMGLLALMVLEFNGVAVWALHGLGGLLVVGRLMHGWALSWTAGNAFARTGGMALTLGMLGLSALLCLWVFVAG